MPIKIGMRTVKTAVCAGLAIMIAQALGLLSPTAAGIIALLSVTNSKKSSFKTGFYRVCSLGLATVVACIAFRLIGYNALAFSCYLVVFIPLAVKGHMSEGIAVSSVLVTHYLIAESLSWKLIANSFLLLLIGVGLALLANLFMPNTEDQLKQDQARVDQKIQLLLLGMCDYLKKQSRASACDTLLADVVGALEAAEKGARRHDDNLLLTDDLYYLDYFTMRRLQVNVLTKMNELVQLIDLEHGDVTGVIELLIYTEATFSKDNDGLEISRKIQEVLEGYRLAPLPDTRLTFENRARLYQFLTEFERFIELKVAFSKEQNIKKRLAR